MKKRNLGKQVLLAGSVMAMAFACQTKKSDSTMQMQQPMDQSAPCDADDGSCNEDEDNMNQSDENTSSRQAPAAPTVEKTPAPPAPTVTAPAPAAPKSEAPPVAAQKAEATKPVTEAAPVQKK